MPIGAERGPLALADTSVIVPALLADSPHHQACRDAIDRARAGASGHAWIESYSVLTRLPPDVRVSAAESIRALDALVDSYPLGRTDDRAFRTWLGSNTVAGGAVYDALVGWAARSRDLPILTRDTRALPTYRLVGVEALVVGA